MEPVVDPSSRPGTVNRTVRQGSAPAFRHLRDIIGRGSAGFTLPCHPAPRCRCGPRSCRLPGRDAGPCGPAAGGLRIPAGRPAEPPGRKAVRGSRGVRPGRILARPASVGRWTTFSIGRYCRWKSKTAVVRSGKRLPRLMHTEIAFRKTSGRITAEPRLSATPSPSPPTWAQKMRKSRARRRAGRRAVEPGVLMVDVRCRSPDARWPARRAGRPRRGRCGRPPPGARAPGRRGRAPRRALRPRRPPPPSTGSARRTSPGPCRSGPAAACAATSSDVVPKNAISRSWMVPAPFSARAVIHPSSISRIRPGPRPVFRTCPPAIDQHAGSALTRAAARARPAPAGRGPPGGPGAKPRTPRRNRDPPPAAGIRRPAPGSCGGAPGRCEPGKVDLGIA